MVGEGKSHFVVVCLFVEEEEDSIDDLSVLEGVMMEGEQSVAVAAGACHCQHQAEEDNNSTLRIAKEFDSIKIREMAKVRCN